jgi:hypothetical protein
MMRAFTLGLVAAFTLPAMAEDAPKYTGTWVKEAEGLTLSAKFGKPGELVWKIEAGDASLTMDCTYTVEKDGLLKIKMVKKTAKGDFPFDPKDGFTFQFKIKIEKDEATLSDFDASEGADSGKAIVEGKYKKQAEK